MTAKTKRTTGRMRLPKGEKKIQIVTYVQEKKIDALGGAPAVRRLIQLIVESEYDQTLLNKQKNTQDGTQINTARP